MSPGVSTGAQGGPSTTYFPRLKLTWFSLRLRPSTPWDLESSDGLGNISYSAVSVRVCEFDPGNPLSTICTHLSELNFPVSLTIESSKQIILSYAALVMGLCKFPATSSALFLSVKHLSFHCFKSWSYYPVSVHFVMKQQICSIPCFRFEKIL